MPSVVQTTTPAAKTSKSKSKPKKIPSSQVPSSQVPSSQVKKKLAPKKSTPVPKKSADAVPLEVPTVAPPKETAAPLENSVEAQFVRISQKIANLRSDVSLLNGEFRTLCKFYGRERRETARLVKKGGRRQGNTKPSGFAKPGYISPELCNFLGKPDGTEMARTDVTKYLTMYIKDNNLQNQKNKKEIICDKALEGLLQPDKDDIITYFNLQSYMKRHYELPGLAPCQAVG